MAKRTTDMNGFLILEANPISMVGVFPYTGEQIDFDGRFGLDKKEIYWVFRGPDALFSDEAMKSFNGKPFIKGHTMLGKGFTAVDKRAADGCIFNVRKSLDLPGYLLADFCIYTEKMKDAITAGTKELSLAYRCDYERKSGVYKGKSYDFIQTNLRGNHIALVEHGRCGSSVCVCDSALVLTCDSLPKEVLEMSKKEEDRYGKLADAIANGSDEDLKACLDFYELTPEMRKKCLEWVKKSAGKAEDGCPSKDGCGKDGDVPKAPVIPPANEGGEGGEGKPDATETPEGGEGKPASPTDNGGEGKPSESAPTPKPDTPEDKKAEPAPPVKPEGGEGGEGNPPSEGDEGEDTPTADGCGKGKCKCKGKKTCKGKACDGGCGEGDGNESDDGEGDGEDAPSAVVETEEIAVDGGCKGKKPCKGKGCDEGTVTPPSIATPVQALQTGKTCKKTYTEDEMKECCAKARKEGEDAGYTKGLAEGMDRGIKKGRKQAIKARELCDACAKEKIDIPLTEDMTEGDVARKAIAKIPALGCAKDSADEVVISAIRGHLTGLADARKQSKASAPKKVFTVANDSAHARAQISTAGLSAYLAQ